MKLTKKQKKKIAKVYAYYVLSNEIGRGVYCEHVTHEDLTDIFDEFRSIANKLGNFKGEYTQIFDDIIKAISKEKL